MHKLVYFDMSLHARPSHAEWQGKIVSLSGREGYLSTDDIGYGTGAGFKGYNCRHDWFPFFEGISEKAYSDKELEQRKNETVTYNDKTMSRYDAEQRQRTMERQIRKERSELAGLDAAIKATEDEELKTSLKNDFDNLSVKLKSHEAKYKDFSYKTGLPPQKQRLQMYGFNRSVSQKAVHANKATISSKNAFTKDKDNDIIKTKKQLSDLGNFKKLLQDDTNIDNTYYSVVKKRFSHGSKTAKSVFNKYVSEGVVADSNYYGTARYDPKSQRIFMNYEYDINNPRGSGVTWFHEHAHLIDDKAGKVSQNKEFAELLRTDYMDYMRQYGKNNKLNTFDKVQSAISRDLSDMRKHSGVSDILQGISEGNIRGVAGHSLDYWENPDNLCSEAFAHMFECEFDEVRYKQMQQYFPKSLKKFEEMLGELV